MDVITLEAGAGGLSEFITSITGALADITTGNLSTILVAALGLTGGLAIAWFAYRFIVRKVKKGITKGGL